MAAAPRLDESPRIVIMPHADVGALPRIAPPIRPHPSGTDRMVLIATKLRPPPVHADMLHRQHLLDQLNRGSSSALTLVACPADSARPACSPLRTTEAVQHRPMAWLTLERTDNDLVVLWSYLLEALHRACPDIDESLPTSALDGPVAIVDMPSHLVNALDGQPSVILILDDFHLLTDGPARESVTWLDCACPRQPSIGALDQDEAEPSASRVTRAR